MPDTNISVQDAIKSNTNIGGGGDGQDTFRTILLVLADIRRELRLSNYLLSTGLNVQQDDLDSLRNDPAEIAALSGDIS